MSHLGDERLLELGLDPAATPSRHEHAHLSSCERCAAALASERELSRRLAVELPKEEPPRDFVARTQTRFRAALAAKPVAPPRASFRPIVWVLAASLGLAIPAGVLLASNAGPILQYLVVGAKDAMVLVSTLALVASKVPLGPIFVAASSATLLIGWSLAMSRLMNLGAREINGPAAA